ncbi:hypothetical protein OAK19_03605, partial [Aureispira]|nr:hypothetical protein [Aureispira sp.]
MKQKDKLFELIKVLNNNEKQWIVKCLKAFKQNNNLLLFKCMDKQESYNKKHLLASLKSAPFLKYLPVQKNNLYNSILKFLKSYINEAEEGCAEHLDSFFEFTFLQNRGLGNYSLGQLKKIQKQATEHQEHYQMLQMISMESDIISSGLHKPASIEDLDTINSSYIEGLDLLKDIWNYKFWASKISVLRNNPEILSTVEQEQILASIKDFITTHKAPNNQIARYYYYQVNLLYYLYIEDFEKAFFYTEIQIDYIENVNLKTYKAQKEKAITFVNSVAIAFLAKVEDSKIEVLLEKTHRLLKKDIFIPFHIPLYNQLYYNQLNHYNFKNYTTYSTQLVEEILHKHKTASLDISPNLSLSIASYYFIQRDLDQAIVWNNKIMSAPKKSILYFVHYNALVLKLLIHIELDNVFYLQSILQSIKRYITKKELSNDFNNNLYRFFKKLESEMLSAFPNTTTLCR